MRTFTVYYNLRTEGVSYQDFFAELEYLEDIVHVSQNLFMLSSMRSPDEIYNRLEKFLGYKDSLLVTQVFGPWVGRVSPQKEQWLQDHLV